MAFGQKRSDDCFFYQRIIMETSAQIGFIGIGKMGSPMARHLIQAGYRVQVFDTDTQRVADLVALGASSAASVREVAGNPVLFSSLPHDAALHAVVFGEHGLLAGAQQGAIYVDTSTVSVAISGQVASACAQHGIAYLRIPVSGNAVVAETAGLTTMASGPQVAYEHIKPLLEKIGKVHFYLGDAEQARTMKLVINLMIAVSNGMMAEALALGSKGGLAWNDLLDVMESSAIASPMVRYKAATLRNHDYVSTFSAEQMAKDLQLILAAAQQTHVPVPLAAQTMQLYQAVIGTDRGALDYSAVTLLAMQLAGAQVKTSRQ
jgi:3-hydroxyisobutyrate dehydrogenase-like beta-hydroxyacid dehydrogenase